MDEKFTAFGNFIENKANVQFNHRTFAYLTYFASLGFPLCIFFFY